MKKDYGIIKLKAVILAAGEGKRLRPLTKDRPKGMIEIAGKSLIQHQIETFQKFNIKEIFIVTGYLGNKINFKDVSYFNNEKYDTTNMVETLFCAKEILTEEVIVSYGDIIFEGKVLQKLIESVHDLTVVVDINWKKYWEMRFDNPLSDAESLVLDSERFIQSIGQKVNNISEIQGQYIGLMKFQGKGLEDLKKIYQQAKKQSISGSNVLNHNVKFEKSYMTDFLQALISSGLQIKSVPIKNGWLEVDSINDYELYQKMINDGTISEIFSFNSINKD